MVDFFEKNISFNIEIMGIPWREYPLKIFEKYLVKKRGYSRDAFIKIKAPFVEQVFGGNESLVIH